MSALLLGFDASTPQCVIVVGRVGSGAPQMLAFDDEEERPNQASARLVERIDGVLRSAGVSVGELAAVACGRGPGTFTGVRVALATAKGIALGAGVDVLPVSTLDALGASAGTEGFVVPLLDARREEVYGTLLHCSFDPSPALQHRTEERVAPLQEVLEAAATVAGDEPVTTVGTGAAAYRDKLPTPWRFDPDGPLGPTPVGLLAAMAAAHERGEAVAPGQAEATYLRKSYAELGINKPKRPFVKSPFV